MSPGRLKKAAFDEVSSRPFDLYQDISRLAVIENYITLRNAAMDSILLMVSDIHTWYVAYRQPNAVACVYVRNSKTFATELEAKKFARERLEGGCDVSAGTINPHRPKRTIGLAQIASWLEVADLDPSDRVVIKKI